MAISSFINHARSIQQLPQIDRILQTQLLWMFLLRTVLYTALLIISYFLEETDFNILVVPSGLFFLLILTIYAFTIFSAFYLLIFLGNQREFGFIQTGMDTIFVSILIFFSGTSHSNFAIVYFFPIISGGLILPMRGGLITAALSTLEYGVLLFLEFYNIAPPYLDKYQIYSQTTLNYSLNLFAVHGLLFFLTGLLSIFFGQRLRHTETALSSSLEQLGYLSVLYKKIFDNISTGILTLDQNRQITSVNNALLKITGRPIHQLVGKRLQEIFPDIQLKEENERYTIDYKRGNETLRLGYSLMLIPDSNLHSQSLKSDVEIAELIITMRDITEIESLEQQVRQAEKLAAIGTMSASIAHDFRNPLTAISGSAQVLALEFSNKENDTNLELANIIIRESNRMTETIGEFLKFARPEQPHFAWISLQKCIEEVKNMLRAGKHFPQTAKIECNFEQNIAVWSDEKQLFTLLTHLIENAMPFCPKGEERLYINAEEIADEYESELQLSVSDNGIGVSEESMNLLFDPFYTTRTDGTGLGLAIVQQIVKDHHGQIVVANTGLKNKKGSRGASFTVTFPLPDPDNAV